jgi:hypothetical protein
MSHSQKGRSWQIWQKQEAEGGRRFGYWVLGGARCAYAYELLGAGAGLSAFYFSRTSPLSKEQRQLQQQRLIRTTQYTAPPPCKCGPRPIFLDRSGQWLLVVEWTELIARTWFLNEFLMGVGWYWGYPISPISPCAVVGSLAHIAYTQKLLGLWRLVLTASSGFWSRCRSFVVTT